MLDVGQHTAKHGIKCECLQVRRGDVVARQDGLLEGDDLIKTAVRVEASLDVRKRVDRTVGTSTTTP